MKVTLDTNVLASATFWTGDSHRIVVLIDQKKIELVLSEEIIDEYFDVANRDEIIEKVVNKGLITSEIIDRVISHAIIVEPEEKLDVIKDDPDDNKVLECAISGKVDYIVTKDKHLLNLKDFRGIKIIKPEEFLNVLKDFLII